MSCIGLGSLRGLSRSCSGSGASLRPGSPVVRLRGLVPLTYRTRDQVPASAGVRWCGGFSAWGLDACMSTHECVCSLSRGRHFVEQLSHRAYLIFVAGFDVQPACCS